MSYRAADVDGGEGGKDEGLQRRDQAQLEQVEQDRKRQGEPAQERQPEQHRESAGHEQDDQVAGQDVGEESDGQGEQPHEGGDDLQRKDQQQDRPADAARDQALEITDRALGADADPVEGDEHDQGENERHRDVGGGGVERERRDVSAEDDELLAGVGWQRDVPDQVVEPDEEEQRAEERKPLRRHRVGHVAASDVVAHEREEHLDGGLHLVGPLVHPVGDPHHRHHGEDRGQDEVENRAVDAEDAEVEPVVELELVLDLEAVVLMAEAEEDDQDHDPGHVEAGDGPEELAGGT